jgi:hypothetical protein
VISKIKSVYISTRTFKTSTKKVIFLPSEMLRRACKLHVKHENKNQKYVKNAHTHTCRLPVVVFVSWRDLRRHLKKVWEAVRIMLNSTYLRPSSGLNGKYVLLSIMRKASQTFFKCRRRSRHDTKTTTGNLHVCVCAFFTYFWFLFSCFTCNLQALRNISLGKKITFFVDVLNVRVLI